MIKLKYLLLFLLLLPTLCLAELGEYRDEIIRALGNPDNEYVVSSRTKMVRFVYSNPDLYVVIFFLNDKSVIETFYNRKGGALPFEFLKTILTIYSNAWISLPDVAGGSCVVSSNGSVRVCYGAIPGTDVKQGLTVLSMAEEDRVVVEDMSAATNDVLRL